MFVYKIWNRNGEKIINRLAKWKINATISSSVHVFKSIVAKFFGGGVWSHFTVLQIMDIFEWTGFCTDELFCLSGRRVLIVFLRRINSAVMKIRLFKPGKFPIQPFDRVVCRAVACYGSTRINFNLIGKITEKSINLFCLFLKLL